MKKILIIGAGIIGMLSARLLAKAGCDVTIIEQGYAGKESSWAGGGIISPLYPWRYNDAVTKLALWGQKHYPQLLNDIKTETDIDPEYTQSGLLYLDIEDELDKASAWAKHYGYTLEELQGNKLNAIEPALNPSNSQGWFTASIGQVRNPRLVRAGKKMLELQDNINLQQNTRMTDLLFKNNQLIGIQTERGKFYADQVVIAGGAWSAKLLDGIIDVPRIAPVKGQMIVFKAPENLVKRIVLSKGRYVIPRLDGRVVLGSTLEFKDFDKTTNEQTLQELKQEAIRIIPELADYPVEKQWAGLRPGSIDGIPYIGEHPQVKNLFINAGHFRNGIVIGYASCELLKNIILQEQPIIPPTPYQLNQDRMLQNSTEINLKGAI